MWPRTTSSAVTSSCSGPPVGRRSSAARWGETVRRPQLHACAWSRRRRSPVRYMTGGQVVILGPTGRNFPARDVGRHRLKSTTRRAVAANLNTEMVDLGDLDDTEHQVAARHARRAIVMPRIRLWPNVFLADWPRQAGEFVKVMPHDYKNVPGRHRPGRTDQCGRGRSMGRPVADPSGFLKVPAVRPRSASAGPASAAGLERGLQDFDHEALRLSGRRCVDCGIPFCHNGCPLNLIPVERPGVTGTGGATRSSACTPPTTSRSSPAGCARHRVRRRACWASTPIR